MTQATQITQITSKLDSVVASLRRVYGDGYENVATGMGTPGHSKSIHTRFRANRVLERTELENLYRDNGVAARIVDRIVDDATRSDWRPVGTDKRFDWTSVKSRLDDLHAMRNIGDAWRWARLYRGALLVMAVNDGRPYSEPLDLANAKSIRGFETLDSTTAIPCLWGPNGALAALNPTHYQVMTPWSGLESAGKMLGGMDTIHASRVIRFDGCRVPPSMLLSGNGWGQSVLQRCERELTAYGSALESTQELLHELSVMVLKMPNYAAEIAGDSAAEAGAREMLRLLRWGIDNHNILLLDSSHEYQEVKRSVEGLEKLLDRFERALVSACGLPRLILTGEQASGLGASSGDEVRSHYDSVEAQRKEVVGGALSRILEIEFACRRNGGKVVPTEWTIEFGRLTTPEPKAKAEIDTTLVNAAATMLDKGLINLDQARAWLVSRNVLDELPTDDEGDLIDPTATELAPVDAGEVVAEPEPVISMDPVPSDAQTPQEIAAALGVTTVRVTRLVREGKVRLWNKLGKRVISLAEVHGVIAADNEPDAEAEVEVP